LGDPPADDRLQRLDPDRAAAQAADRSAAQAADRAAEQANEAQTQPRARERSARPQIDTRRYQRIIGALALVLVIVFSLIQLTSHHPGTAGVPPGTRIKPFSAPLATSNLVGDANLRPPCDPAHHDPRALNVCLLQRRGPLVLAFFVTNAGTCEDAVTALQTVADTYSSRGVQFAAVAVNASHTAAAAAVRRHGWRIPVAYDRDGAVGETYGVAVCPLLQLVRQGGVVARRLIGKRWTNATALAAAVRGLAGR
jgi:peroxiredoxin